MISAPEQSRILAPDEAQAALEQAQAALNDFDSLVAQRQTRVDELEQAAITAGDDPDSPSMQEADRLSRWIAKVAPGQRLPFVAAVNAAQRDLFITTEMIPRERMRLGREAIYQLADQRFKVADAEFKAAEQAFLAARAGRGGFGEMSQHFPRLRALGATTAEIEAVIEAINRLLEEEKEYRRE